MQLHVQMGQHAGLARLALLYVVGLLLRLLLLVLVWLYHIGFIAARSCSCEGEGPERRTRTQYIRYISLCTDVQCVIDKTGSIATIRVLVQCIVSNYIKLEVIHEWDCCALAGIAERPCTANWTNSGRRVSEDVRVARRKSPGHWRSPARLRLDFQKKMLHVSLGNAVYLFRFLWSVFFSSSLFLLFYNLFSTLYYSRTQQKLFDYLEVSYKDVPSFHDRTITYLGLDSRVHHLALLHFGCGCMVQSYRFSGMAWQSSAIPMEKAGICIGAANQSNRCRRTQTQVA